MVPPEGQSALLCHDTVSFPGDGPASLSLLPYVPRGNDADWTDRARGENHPGLPVR